MQLRLRRLHSDAAGVAMGYYGHMPHDASSLDAWSAIYRQTTSIIGSLNRDTLLFRGHSSADWPLVPGMARARKPSDVNIRFDDDHSREQTLFFEFSLRAGELLTN